MSGSVLVRLQSKLCGTGADVGGGEGLEITTGMATFVTKLVLCT